MKERKKMPILTLEVGMNGLEEGFAKAMMIMDGHPARGLFTAEEYMKYYDCVYQMCIQPPTHNYSSQLVERFRKALEESIFSRVLPSLSDKGGAHLLAELLRLWANYKSMVRILLGFYGYLDRRTTGRENAVPLSEISICCFSDLVCNAFLQQFIDAAISLITQDRNGQPIDQTFLRSVSNFFIEVGGQSKALYYNRFEEAILADTANYYSQVVPEWLQSCSSVEYSYKAEQCFREETGRAITILFPPGVEKLLQIVHRKLIGEMTEQQNAENLDSSKYKEILEQCARLSIG